LICASFFLYHSLPRCSNHAPNITDVSSFFPHHLRDDADQPPLVVGSSPSPSPNDRAACQGAVPTRWRRGSRSFPNGCAFFTLFPLDLNLRPLCAPPFFSRLPLSRPLRLRCDFRLLFFPFPFVNQVNSNRFLIPSPPSFCFLL